ncbi:MAG: hypothetical protein ACRCWJ_05390 [Casimicrobium sp.]
MQQIKAGIGKLVFALLLIAYAGYTFAQVQNCPFAVSGGSIANFTVDSTALVRFARGARDASLTRALGSTSALAGADSYITNNSLRLDIDSDKEFTSVDALIIARYVAGYRGAALTSGITFPSNATRRNVSAIMSYIEGGCGAQQTRLPIEVIGSAGYIESIAVDVADARNVNRLWMQCHRCGYRDGTSAIGAARGAKGSVRVNGGAWVNIDDQAATLEMPERAYGGVAGGFFTTRLSVPISGVRVGSNKIDFRFNATDGFTSGYRVLAFNFLRADSSSVLPSNVFYDDDPTLWRVGGTSADISAGKALWEGRVALRESPLSNKTIRASCSSCHARDGRDLKYFNYSDWSIVARSQFHGLTTKQGEQLAAYIRNLPLPAPKQARPWNPPYQPAAGIDARPVTEWAAGGGLQVVLANDNEMLRYLFPNASATSADVSNASLARIARPSGSLNIREMPIALQFPDWNAWLPEVHPLDIWGDLFNVGVRSPSSEYETLRNTLRTTGVAQLIANGNLQTRFSRLNSAVRMFIGEGATDGTGDSPWRTTEGTHLSQSVNGYAREQVKLSLAQWSAIKQWELIQEYELEAVAPQALPSGGELRAWPSDGQSVHPLAPHIVANDQEAGFEWQSRLVGKYFSSAWYQLQMTLNSGQRQAVNVEPQDWPYQFKHVMNLREISGEPQALRMSQSLIKAYQMRNNGVGAELRGWQMRIAHPLWLIGEPGDASSSTWDDVETYDIPGVTGSVFKQRLLSALANSALDVTTSFATSPITSSSIGNWSICGVTVVSTWACLQSPTAVVEEPTKPKGFDYPAGQEMTANNLARTLRIMKEKSLVNQATRQRYIDWANLIWTTHNWNQYR